MRNLPLFPLFNWSRSMPVLIVDRQVLLYSRRQRDLCGYIEWEGETYGLAKVQTLEEMASDYFKQHISSLERWQAEILMEKEGRSDLLSMSKEKMHELEAAIFLGHRLIPSIQRLRGEPVSSFPISAFAVMRIRRSLNRYLRRFDRSLLDLAPLWSALPPVKSWGFIDGQLYHLVLEAKEGVRESRNRIVFAGESYALEEQRQTTQVMEGGFYDKLAELLMGQARRNLLEITALSDKVKQAVEPYENLLQSLLRDSRGRAFLYDSSTWCIFYWQGEWFVGLLVEPYALEDSDGSLYAFDSTTVVARVCLDGPLPSVETLTPCYEHPFLPSEGSIICMGNYTQNGSVSLRSFSPEERLMQYLTDARQTLRAGYHHQNLLSPFRPLYKFPHRRITREQATARNLPVYPFYRSESHGRAS